MELDELKAMSAPDLRVKAREAREEVFKLRLRLRTNQLDNHASYRRARRELARIMTLIGQKTAGGAAPQKKESNARAN